MTLTATKITMEIDALTETRIAAQGATATTSLLGKGRTSSTATTGTTGVTGRITTGQSGSKCVGEKIETFI